MNRRQFGIPTVALLVETEPLLARTLRRLLVRFGFEVLLAVDGARAVAMMQNLEPGQLALAVTNLEAARALRAQGPVPLLCVSPGLEEAENAEYQALGAALLLEPPFDATKLLAGIRQLLGPSTPVRDASSALSAKYLGGASSSANRSELKHPGTIAYEDEFTQVICAVDDVPEWLHFGQDAFGNMAPIVRIVTTVVGNLRYIRHFDDQGRLLRTTVQLRRSEN